MSLGKDEIQELAINAIRPHKRCGVGISMGVGKTLLGLKRLDELFKEKGLRRIVVAYPKVSIKNSWINDANKFGLSYLLEYITFTTYLSLGKINLADTQMLILDECHSLLFTHKPALDNYKGWILGLTGTPPKRKGGEKGTMVNQYCPIVYTYEVKEAVDDRILNDYRITVHLLNLDDAENHFVPMKNGRGFWTSEKKSYEYWSERIFESEGHNKMLAIMRMKSLQNYRSKEEYALKLLKDIPGKCIIFANTKDQADRISRYRYYSGNPANERNLQMFNDDEINQLVCVLQLNEGINIKNLRYAIILHAYGNERKSAQRIGRLLRLLPDDTAHINLLCYKNTVDQLWVQQALEGFDNDKISYIDTTIKEDAIKF